MKHLSEPFTSERNQVFFCSLGLFWVSNIGKLLSENLLLSRLFIYPVYLALLLIFIYLLSCIHKNKENLNSATYSSLCLLVILATAWAIRGIVQSPNIDTIRTLLFSESDATLVWLMPVALLYGLNKQFWFTWLPRLRSIVAIGILYVIPIMIFNVITGYYLDHKMYNSSDFLFVSAFLIIFSIYDQNKIGILTGILGVIILVVHMFLVNERFAIAYVGLMCIVFVLNILFTRHIFNMKFYAIFAGIVLILLLIIVATNTSFMRAPINTYLIQGKLWEDTRRGGELAAAATRGMSAFEKAFGRGVRGAYAYGYQGWPPRLFIRSNVEIGYKQIIHKNGYAMLACMLVLSVCAVYLGIFRSNNRVTKYLAYIIIARLIIMTTAMIPRVGFEYFLYWLVVGGCLSSQLRELDDITLENNCINKYLVIKW